MTLHPGPLRTRTLLAWGVHLYTAIGGVVGMFALFNAALGYTREAFLLLVVTLLIDATDGLMARAVRVREVLPGFDGAMLDNVIDTLTFAWIPVFILWQEALLPHPLFLVLPVLASLYAYGQVNMKTEDSFFLGFPTYWNIVALYLYWLRPVAVVAVLLVALFTVLTFVPTRYLYPSKNAALWQLSWGLGSLWFVLIIGLLLQPEPPLVLVWVSLLYPLYYLGASFYLDWRLRRK